MSLEILSDNAVQPCSSTPTSSGTPPPPPALPPPLQPIKPQPGKQIKNKTPVVKTPGGAKALEGRSKHTAAGYPVTTSSAPAIPPDIEPEQGDGIKAEGTQKDKKSVKSKGFKNIFRRK